MTEPERFEAWPDLAAAAAERLADSLLIGLGERGAASLALAGGSTPADIYRRLSSWPLAWRQVTATLTDERWVSPDSPDSNARLIRETLLSGAAAEAGFIPLMDPTAQGPEEVARRAEAALAEAPWPLDAVLLGMGSDGHFASLFPGNPALQAGLALGGGSMVIAVPAGRPAPPQPRLSLTLDALRGARTVLLVIRGAEKLAVLSRAEAEGLPVAALLRHTSVRTLWAP
jgi:6-phosphogluconolactonase